MREVLRVGLLLDEPAIPWWIAPAFQSAAERRIASIVLVVLRETPPATEPRLRPLRWWNNRSFLGFALLQRFERFRLRGEVLPADLPLSELADAPVVLRVRPELTRFSDRLRAEDVREIETHRLDVLVRIGFRILRGDVLRSARHGVWSFHHGDSRRYRGGPAGVWEVLEDAPESGVTLQRLTEELDGGEVLARATAATSQFSGTRNWRTLLALSPPLLHASLEHLHAGLEPSQGAAGSERWDGYARNLYRTPTNRELMTRVPLLFGRYLARRWRSRGRKLQWSLGWHYATGQDPDAPSGVLHRYREIRPPQDRFWADPFIVRDGERWWMFFEELREELGRGQLLVWEMSRTGPVGKPELILSRPYHLSYPQVFQFEKQWYLLPETAAERRVELYRAEGFPRGWTLCQVIRTDVRVVDPTLLNHNGYWYLFGTESDALHAFVGPSPTGPFSPHPRNPLNAEASGARMGGGFFHAGGALYRPAQLGAPFYGYGLAVFEVTELTPERYSERQACRLEPHWDRTLRGLHTLNAADGLSVTDFLRLVRR